MNSRCINFSPGPSALPLSVLQTAREELLNFSDTGMSVMEQSHRGPVFEAICQETLALIRELCKLPQDYTVLLLQGGASLQFAQVPLNFLGEGETASYLTHGLWGEKALAEARIVAAARGAHIHLAAHTGIEQDGKFAYTRVPLPKETNIHPSSAFLHLTSNETVHGLQFEVDPEHPFPVCPGVPIACDMSSDFLSRPFDYTRFDLIYASAQKNIGPSGVGVVIVRNEWMEKGRLDLPKILQYRIQAQAGSLYHTPPTFAIYMMRQVLLWKKSVGGIEQIAAWNREKSSLIYQQIDRYPELYRSSVERTSRSIMNVVFYLPTAALESAFLVEAKVHGMVGLRGHSRVGGIRVSLYNAIPVEWARTLSEFMGWFAENNG
ncbi:3-phosphoserine/phosphohydroxythreonine transaminase [Pajaroellobacter abortibovis]|uniref:Phosphoserine aminotransferase n=1 Tax=Pajaroellobacter abortibovis TaxID=1882918 RepID=A0A1L6MXX5_9BACT|nr:3-phosphoserine/phosphohydroxythreonine transaminase [Pajaroellobacter abortibovis]APS00255.1 phosphoserine transaminase [Pajaroellobacter abortibovis]